MKKMYKLTIAFCISLLFCFGLTGCQNVSRESVASSEPEVAVSEEAETEQTDEVAEPETEDTDDLGETFDGEVQEPDDEEDFEEESDQEEALDEDETEQETQDENLVDLIFFMGQSNMSGCGGDASLAPAVAEEAGMEYRSVSDPTRLYPLTEPFGINENRIGGLIEYPNGKKGSLVSAFINEYYALTGRRVVAVSASKGETSIDDFTQDNIMADIASRYAFSKSYLSNNGYTLGHIYVVWLQGESDALEKVDPEVYRTKLDDFMRPLFIDGLEKVFIITPGRTYDYKNLYSSIIDMQKKICIESDYYALATTVLTGVSTEYMTDMYHYNQHVLNLVGQEAAKSVAFYATFNTKRVVYDYREQNYIVPNGADLSVQVPEEPVDLTKINEEY